MTREEYQSWKDIKEIVGKILMKIAENYSIKINLAIKKLVEERLEAGMKHEEIYRQATDKINEYEVEHFDELVRAEIEEMIEEVQKI